MGQDDRSGERKMITKSSKSETKKLSLKRETLRELTTTDLEKVVGGFALRVPLPVIRLTGDYTIPTVP
jgi:hypothetical protein